MNHVHDFDVCGWCACGDRLATIPKNHVDRVEALAKVLEAADMQRAANPLKPGTYWEALARAALAHARELVPEGYPPFGEFTAGWNACRAETLRRLGGEET